MSAPRYPTWQMNACISLSSVWLQLLSPLSCSYLLFVKRECFCSTHPWNKPVWRSRIVSTLLKKSYPLALIRWQNNRRCRWNLLQLGASSCPVWCTALKELPGTQWACAERWWTGPGLLSLPVSASTPPVPPANHNRQGIHRALSTPIDRKSPAELSQPGMINTENISITEMSPNELFIRFEGCSRISSNEWRTSAAKAKAWHGRVFIRMLRPHSDVGRRPDVEKLQG